MKVTVPFIWLVLATGLVEASSLHAERDVSAHGRLLRHRRVPVDVPAQRRDAPKKRCTPKKTSSSASPTHTSSPKPQAPAQSPDTKTTKSSQPPKETTAPKPAPVSGGQNLIKVASSKCGPNGATHNITPTSGPNGEQGFLICGLDGAGWTPANVQVGDLVTADLATVLKQPNNPFSGCKQYVDLFYQNAAKYGLPAIMLASIAMQESSCQANEVGGAGEQGLMQITKEKCEGRSPSDCRDPAFNIQKGAEYLSGLINQHNGNILIAMGQYNGLVPGATMGELLKRPACEQPNFDYFQDVFNGYFQGRDPSAPPRLGKYHNYDKCQG